MQRLMLLIFSLLLVLLVLLLLLLLLLLLPGLAEFLNLCESPLIRLRIAVSAQSSRLWPVAKQWAPRRRAPRSKAWRRKMPQ